MTSRRALLLVIVLLAALGASGCTSVQADAVETTDFAGLESYAWWSGETPDDVPGAPAADPAVFAQVREAVDAALARRGLRQVPPEEAALLVLSFLTVEERMQHNDPYFDMYAVEMVEDGTLTLEFLDAESGRRLWRGSATSLLRTTAHGVGVQTVRFVETEQERDWQAPRKVRAILARFPVRHEQIARE